jgi:succinoglycan biosynthesis transport protein ExoP
MGDSANFFVTGDQKRFVTTNPDRATSAFAAMFERYWRALRRHLAIASAIVVGALVVAIIATLLAVPKYTASSRLEITREGANITNVQGLESERQNQDLEFYQTQYSLLEARSVAERVAGRLNVVASDRFFDLLDYDIDSAVRERAMENGASVARLRLDKATDLLLQQVAIRPVPGSRLVDVSFSSPSPTLSAEIANEWVDQFQQATVARRFDSTSDARDFLEAQLAEMRDKLEESQRRLVNYAAANEIITLSTDQDNDGNTDASETLRTSDLKSLNQALGTATAQRIAAQSQAGQTNSANQNALSNIALNNMREQRATAAGELAQQLAIFEPDYPAVQALQAQVDSLDRAIAGEESRIQRAAGTSYREALDREQRLRAAVNQLKSATVEEQRASIQYAIYQREVDTNRELYEGLLQRYKEIGVAGVGASNIAVVDRAVVPEEPTSPSMPLNLALGFLVGLSLASAYVFVREEVDQSIKDPSQVTELFDLPLLGAIPQEAVDEIDKELQDVKSPVSEAYFSAASNLSFLTPNGAPSSFAVTSTRPNEGKSTSAYALAVALSRTGKRTLLIDCDLRNPSQHENFDRPKEPGLSNLLSGGDASDPNDYCLATDRPDLFFMPAGPLAPNPGALLIDEKLTKIVRRLGEHYDHVIVDGPPMLGLADAPLMSKAVDGVIYTIEANGVRTRAIETGLKRLRFSGATLFGALVTKLNSQNSAYGYGYGYGYGYSYGSRDDAEA